MTAGYTPTTEEVREAYAEDDVGVPRPKYYPEFDRWLNKINAEAWEQGYAAAPMGGRPRQENPYRTKGLFRIQSA